MTEIQNESGSKVKNLRTVTLQKTIPNSYVYKCDLMDCKDDEGIHFDEDELESTINAIIGNQPKAFIKKDGKQTKFKKMQTNNDEIDEDELYFCVLISYIRYPLNENGKQSEDLDDEKDRKRLYESDESEDKESENEEEEKNEIIEDFDALQQDGCQQLEVINENGINYKIEALEISIFEAPSAICPTNQIRKKSKKESKTNPSDKNIENALDPSLCLQFLCDFKLQRLVEYYDIFGISSDAGNCDEKSLDCKICFSFPANVILLPCRHCCCCVECYKQIEVCPMCRKPIRQTLRWIAE